MIYYSLAGAPDSRDIDRPSFPPLPLDLLSFDGDYIFLIAPGDRFDLDAGLPSAPPDPPPLLYPPS